MSLEHRQKEQVRAYLLGVMSGPEAQAFEESYFNDRAFFVWVQAVEVGLIEDYLNGKLPAAKAQSFESRYLHVAPLRKKFEEVREQHERMKATHRLPRGLRWAAFGAMALVLLSVGIYWAGVSSKETRQPALTALNNTPSVHVELVPGVQQGGNSIMTEVQMPATHVPVDFDLEVPGKTVPFQCAVAISEIGADGVLHSIWDSPAPVHSALRGNSQHVIFQVDSSTFHRGDYRVDLKMSDVPGAGAYIFRVVPAAASPKN